jgi:mercuric reductase
MTDVQIQFEAGTVNDACCAHRAAPSSTRVGTVETRASGPRRRITVGAEIAPHPGPAHPGAAGGTASRGPNWQRDPLSGGARRQLDERGPYDLAIVGSGSAAFAAAIKATELGGRVVMIERGTLGGTCINVGCVPSKALLRAAETYAAAGHNPFTAVETAAGKVDLAGLVAQKDELVATMRRRKYADLVEAYGWDLVTGEAAFDDAESLRVDGVRVRAGAYLIATGASPAIPPIPGLRETGFLTSTTALTLTTLPDRLAVIGANAIGLELGQYFARLGSRVTLLEVLPRIAPFEEPEISATLSEILRREGVEIVAGAEITSVDGGQIRALVAGDRRVWQVDAILVAAGRRPNTEALALERAGIATDRRGAIIVDDRLRTTNPRVWAAGDVTSAPQFVYVAAYEGALAAENILADSDRPVDLSALPRVTFTQPQIAAVGLTERQAREAGYDVRVSVLPLSEVPRAIVNGATDGLFKLVADASTDRLLGAHILAENAGDVIDAATIALRFGLTIHDVADHFAPYLTMAEGLKLAAQGFDKDVSRLSCCAA